LTINDIVRGKVTWNTDSLGDFVVLRSNGLPVYNFCVAIDDALMGITHVLRAEEHLPNTLRQVNLAKAFQGVVGVLTCGLCCPAVELTAQS
jgi:glutamyl-tRNA synthetase